MDKYDEILKKYQDDIGAPQPAGNALEDWYGGAAGAVQPDAGTLQDWYTGGTNEPLAEPVDKYDAIARGMYEGKTAAEAVRESMPWWYRAVTFGVGALEFAQLGGDLMRSVAWDIALRKKGERLETLEVLNNLVAYLPWGEAPPRVAPGKEAVERATPLRGTASSTAGFLLEVLFDPFVVADIWGTVLIKGAEKGAARAAQRIAKETGQEVTADMLLNAAKEFDVAGDELMAELARYAAQRSFGQKLKSPILFIPEPARVSIGRTIVSLMDKVPTPFSIEYVGEKGLYKHRLSLAESVLTPQAYRAAFGDDAMGQAMRRLYGEADITDIARGEVKATPALLDRAKQKALHFNALALEAIKSVPESFIKYTGLKPTQAPEAYDLWSKSTAELLDNLLSGQKLSREVIETGKPPNVSELLDYSRGQTQYYERLKRIAKQYGVDEEAMFKAGMEVAKRQLEITTWLGWSLSGMDDYNKLIERTAKGLGVDRSELAQVVWKKAFNKPLNEAEQEMYSALEKAWAKDDVMKFYSVNPLTYLKNISDGYFRRVMGINIQDENFIKAFANSIRAGTKWMPAREINSTAFYDAVKKVAGEDAANKVADFLYAYGDGAISPEMIERYTGVSAKDIATALRDIAYRDITPQLRQKIERALEAGTYSGKRPAASLIGKRLFRSRTVEEDKLAEWLPLARLEERAAGMAAAGRRAIAGQEVLRTMWNELSRLRLVANSPEELAEIGVRKVMQIPNKDIYGPLAGKYIPRYFADQILLAVGTGDPGFYQRALNNLRVMWLASPKTISRNVLGGITMMHAGGMSPQEIVTWGPKAAEDIRQIMKSRDLRVLGPGWEQLKLYGEGEMAAEAGDILLRGLQDIMKKAGRPTTKLQEASERWGKTAANILTGRPMFEAFQYSEDVMRVTVFYALRDRFIKRGIPKDAAGAIAAQYANNILFDYSNQPYMVRWLKRLGLALFPSFPYFNASRTATLIARRPAMVTTAARIPSASDQFLPEEERQMASQIVHGMWLKDQAPILIPTGKGGQFIAVPMKYLLPQLSGSDFFTDSFGEIAAGGVMQTLIDASVALMSGEGKGPFGARYGKEVFSPAMDLSPTERAVKTGLYLLQGYAPGHARFVSDTFANLNKWYRAENPDVLLRAYADEYGYGPAKAIANAFGFNIYELGPAQFIENRQRLEAQFNRLQADLRKREIEARRAGDMKALERVIKQKGEVLKWYLQKLCEMQGGRYVEGRGCE